MKALKSCILLITLVIFALTATVAVAANPWFVIKDKKGVCKVIQAKEKTPKTIAGPFNSKAAAQKAKDQKCPKPAKAAKPATGSKKK